MLCFLTSSEEMACPHRTWYHQRRPYVSAFSLKGVLDDAHPDTLRTLIEAPELLVLPGFSTASARAWSRRPASRPVYLRGGLK